MSFADLPPLLDLILIVGGSLAAGFVSGLSGFGVALVSLGVWLHVMPPATAGTLSMGTSVLIHVQTFRRVWREADWSLLWPFLVPGLIATPLGVALMCYLAPGPLKLGLGLFLLGYCALMVAMRGALALHRGGRFADGVVGAIGGVLGGMVGLSGALTAVWVQLRGWPKPVQRGVNQFFNFAVLTLAILIKSTSGDLDRGFFWLLLLCAPGTIAGAWLGMRAYGKVDDRQFRWIIVGLLALSGAALVGSHFAR